MRPADGHNRLISYASWRRLTVVTSRIRKLFLIIPLFILFAFSLWVPQPAIAAPTSPEAQNVQNPNVTFEKGLLSVQADDVMLRNLMEAISQKAGIRVSINLVLQNEKVTVQFEDLVLEEGTF